MLSERGFKVLFDFILGSIFIEAYRELISDEPIFFGEFSKLDLPNLIDVGDFKSRSNFGKYFPTEGFSN